MDESDGHILRKWISVGDIIVLVTAMSATKPVASVTIDTREAQRVMLLPPFISGASGATQQSGGRFGGGSMIHPQEARPT